MIRRRRPILVGVAHTTLFRRLATVGAALVLVLLSCGREPTAPQARDVAPPRFARGFSFNTVFPQLAGNSAFADLVDFNRVHIVLHRADGSVALDSTVTFPPGVESLTLSFDIRLAPGAPATGEVLSLDLAYLNAAGAVVFAGGPISIVAVPSVLGAPPPPPVTVPVVYTGPGSTARTVRISPHTLSVNTGAPFAFSAVGLDATGATVASTPIFYTVLDPTRATLASSTAGAGTALGVRGTARLVAQLINGAADTATLTINPVASAITAVSGSGQTGIVGKPTPRTLAQPLVVRVTATDGLGVAGVPVTFAAANGGSVTPATVITDASGNAQASWTLGLTALSQTATASAAGLAGSPLTFTATGNLLPATRLSLSSGPTAGSSISSGTPIGVVVTAIDADGDPVSSFTGTVNAALGANPSGGALAGASSVNAVAGVASFTALNIIRPGTGYTLQVTSGSLTPVSTPSFNIVPGAAASLVLLGGGGQSGAAGSILAPVTALVTDVNGNAKAGVAVNFTVASGGGSVAPASVVTDAAGHAVAMWTLGSLVGAQTLTLSSAGISPVTASATAFSALQTWVITQQPSASLIAGSLIAPAVVAELHDAVNARVTGFNGSVTAAIGANPGGSTLGGTATVTAANGVATFPGLSLNKAGTGYTLTVNSTGAAAATTTQFSVAAGAATSLSIASGNAQSGPVSAVLGQPIVALVTDANGNATAGVPVTFTVTAGGGSVSLATGTTDALGHVSTTWTLGATVGAQTLNVASTGLPTVTASANGTSAALSWVFTAQPGTSQVTAGAAVTPAVVAELRTAANAVATTYNGTATLALGANPGGATLGGTTTVTAVNGVATFANITLDKANLAYTFVVSSPAATSATSAPFNVGAGPAATIAILSGNAQTAAVGVALTQPVVAFVSDANGNANAGVTVTVTAATGAGSATPTTGVTDAVGRFSTTWTLGTTVGTQTLAFSSAGLPTVSATATGTGNARTLVITAQPPAALTAGAVIAPPLTVEMRDASNVIVSSFTGAVTMVIGTNPGTATLGGTATVNAVAGVATFSTLTLDKVGTGYTLVASASGATSATSTAVTVSAGAASALSISSGNAQSGAVSAALSQPVVALVTDASGNPKVGVPVAFAVTAGGGSVSLATVNTDAAGHASTLWTLGTLVGAQTLSVSSTGLTTVAATATGTSTTLSWVFTGQPAGSQTAGTAITPALVAELQGAAGARVTTFNGTATLSFGVNAGASALGGTLTVNAVNGVATFSTPLINKVGTGYTLVVRSTGAVDGTTSPFTVVAAAAAILSLQSGGAQSGAYGTALAAPVVALVTDAFLNPVAGTTVTFTAGAGSGTAGTPTASTNGSGVASSTWTLGASGAQTLSIASAGLTGSPVAVSANTGSGTITQTVVSPQRDTITALGLTRQLTAQSRDAAGANVAGSYTWVSRSPTVATVSSTGLVTAVANGSVYVVATEAGGTKDSAQIVVQQRVASVLVTPGTRSLYAGAGFTFTAQAVDGNNVAMTTQPAFTWTSTVPSVATVNAGTGVVAAVAIGSTQIRATAGTFVGVSNLTVITPITRIDVSHDSTGAPVPDVFSLAALGYGRAYRAVARDTLGAVMTGINFTWLSTNTSVALLDTVQATRAHAIAGANGTTSIQATAQGVTGAATLNVAQVLTAIDLQPATLVVAVGGTASVVARGKDANNRYISGGSFSYSSSAPSIATVGSTSGLVTGVGNNATANITATSGSITSNTAVVQVNSSGAAIISFGRDTIGIGRGTTLSVPILLSKPNAAAVTVNLAVADTFAFWSSASVTIPANATSVNATLNGRNAGTTHITAVDGSGTGYASATAVVNVQANMGIVTGATLNMGSQYSTQVTLSDPSPPGGTYVTFAYGTAGKVSVSPDPAFIPAGQLAANLVISGVAVGSSTVTPVATGVTGTAVLVSVVAAQFNFGATTLRLGAGQFDPNQYVQVPTWPRTPLVVSLSSSDSTVASPQPTTTIGANQYYAYYQVSARNVGTASIFANAAGWLPDTLFVTSTTPRVRVSGSTTLNVTSPAQNVSIYATDSAYSTHPRTSSLAVRVSSSDTTIMRVLDTLVTIAAGQSYVSGGARVIPGGAAGTAYVRVTASGHLSDSASFTVNGPALYLGWTTNLVGVGQELPSSQIQIPNAIATPLVITLSNSDSSKAASAQTVTIPAGQYYVNFTVRGKSVGASTFIASAPGYAPDTAVTIVTTPRLAISGGGTIPAYSSTSVRAYVGDSSIYSSFHNRTTALAVTFRSSNPSVLTVDTIATIQPGTFYTQTAPVLQALGPGTAWVIASAAGHVPDSTQWTVQPAKLNLSFYNYTIGTRQVSGASDFNVSLPASRPTPVLVTLTAKTGRVQTTAGVDSIPANQSYAYFGMRAVSAGVDTIVATAPGYLPDTGYVVITSPRLFTYGIPSTANTTAPPYSFYLYAQDSLGSSHATADTVTVHAVSSNINVLQPDSAYFHIPKGTYYAYTRIVYVGTGTATITYSDSVGGYAPITTNSVTVTGPALGISGGSGMLGMRQQTYSSEYNVSTPNTVGTPLVVNLLSTGTRVATVPATVTIPANSSSASFIITAQDTVGTIQIQATATGYTATSVNMQVTPPKFTFYVAGTLNTTAPPSTFYVYARDANGNSHQVAENVIVTLASSAPGVATIDSTTITIPSGQYYSGAAKWVPVSVGTAQLTASDARAAYYQYAPATATVTVQTPTATLSFNALNLAVGQYSDENVQLPDYRTTSTLTVPLTHAAVPATTTPSSVIVPLNAYYQFFRVTGTAIGPDTITASPAGHNAARGTVNVGLGRLDNIYGWPPSLAVGDSVLVTMYSRDPGGSPRYLTAATTFALSPNANIKFVSGGVTITSVVIPADQYSVQFYVKGVSSGAGSASITNSNYTTYTNSVTVP